jgi:hypothetical protein
MRVHRRDRAPFRPAQTNRKCRNLPSAIPPFLLHPLSLTFRFSNRIPTLLFTINHDTICPRLLIAHTLPPTHADNKTPTTTTINMTVTTLVNESAAPTILTLRFPTPLASPRANSPVCLPRASLPVRAIPPVSPSDLRLLPRVQPSTRPTQR